MKLSRTQRAVAMVDAGVTAYQAAKFLGINQSCISRAIKLRSERGAAPPTCPTCKRPLASV